MTGVRFDDFPAERVDAALIQAGHGIGRDILRTMFQSARTGRPAQLKFKNITVDRCHILDQQ